MLCRTSAAFSWAFGVLSEEDRWIWWWAWWDDAEVGTIPDDVWGTGETRWRGFERAEWSKGWGWGQTAAEVRTVSDSIWKTDKKCRGLGAKGQNSDNLWGTDVSRCRGFERQRLEQCQMTYEEQMRWDLGVLRGQMLEQCQIMFEKQMRADVGGLGRQRLEQCQMTCQQIRVNFGVERADVGTVSDDICGTHLSRCGIFECRGWNSVRWLWGTDVSRCREFAGDRGWNNVRWHMSNR